MSLTQKLGWNFTQKMEVAVLGFAAAEKKTAILRPFMYAVGPATDKCNAGVIMALPGETMMVYLARDPDGEYRGTVDKSKALVLVYPTDEKLVRERTDEMLSDLSSMIKKEGGAVEIRKN